MKRKLNIKKLQKRIFSLLLLLVILSSVLLPNLLVNAEEYTGDDFNENSSIEGHKLSFELSILQLSYAQDLFKHHDQADKKPVEQLDEQAAPVAGSSEAMENKEAESAGTTGDLDDQQTRAMHGNIPSKICPRKMTDRP